MAQTAYGSLAGGVISLLVVVLSFFAFPPRTIGPPWVESIRSIAIPVVGITVLLLGVVLAAVPRRGSP